MPFPSAAAAGGPGAWHNPSWLTFQSHPPPAPQRVWECRGSPAQRLSETQPPPSLSSLLLTGPLCPHMPGLPAQHRAAAQHPAAGLGFYRDCPWFLTLGPSLGTERCAEAVPCCAGLRCPQAPCQLAVVFALFGREASAPGHVMLSVGRGALGLGGRPGHKSWCPRLLNCSFVDTPILFLQLENRRT